MTIDDLRDIRRIANVDPRSYSLDSDRDGALCLLRRGDYWRVFESEGGHRGEERSYGEEDRACVYFLKRIFELHQPGGVTPTSTIAGSSARVRD